MGLIASASKSRDPIPDGIYQAVTIGVVDLGHQYNEHYKKSTRQVLLMWEIPELPIKFMKNDVEIEAPRVISKKYTLSLGEKAILRKDLQSWRGRIFTPEELEGFDLQNILGVNCQLQIINTKKNDKVYSNITTIIPIHKQMTVIKSTGNLIYFSMSDTMDIPKELPSWIREVILKSEEMKDVSQDGTYEEGPEPPLTDDIPF